MQQRHLGRSGLRVSALGLGTMTWGRGTDEHDARDQLVAFLDAGGTLLDTAASYGDGAAETLIGSLLGDVVPREELVVATKAGIWRRGGRRSVDISRRALLAGLDASLKRLGTDYVDLWQVHVWSDETPIAETLATLEYAVLTGRARYVGISNYSGWQTAHAATWQGAVPGRVPLVSTQVQYSLLAREVEYEVIPAATALGLGVLAWSPLAGGVLTGKYRSGTPSDSRGASDAFSRRIEANLDERGRGVVEAVLRAADGLGWTPVQVALSWLRQRPGVTSAILGARTVAQLDAGLASADKVLPPELVDALDEVSSD